MRRLHRQLLTAALALGIGGGLLLYVWTARIAPREELAARRREARRLLRYENQEVRAIRLLTRGATLSFTRDGEEWRLAPPARGLADRVAIYALLDHLRELEGDPVETAEPASVYGLDPPRGWVELERAGAPLRLEVGKKNPLDDRYFVRAAGGPLCLAANSFHWTVDRPPDAFRDKRVFPVSRADIAALRFHRGGALVWALERGTAGWEVQGGGQRHAADAGELELLLVLVEKRLRLARFLADDPGPAELARLGLAPPAATLEVLAAGHPPQVLRMGHVASSNEPLPVLVEGTGALGEAPGWLLGDLDKPIGALRDRALLVFPAEQAAALRITRAGAAPLELVRGPEGWRAGGRQASTTRVEALLSTLSRLRANRIFWEPASDGELARGELVEPHARVEVRAAGGALLGELRVGKSVSPEELLLLNPRTRRVGTYSVRFLEALPETPAELTAPN